jgi:hypothetical protein
LKAAGQKGVPEPPDCFANRANGEEAFQDVHG